MENSLQLAEIIKYIPASSQPQPIISRLKHLMQSSNISLPPSNIIVLVQGVINIDFRYTILILVYEAMSVEVYGVHEELSGRFAAESLGAD